MGHPRGAMRNASVTPTFGIVAPPDPLTRIVGVFVPRAVESIDVNQVLGEVDVDAVLARIDVDALLRHVDVDALLRHVDVNGLLERVDVDALMTRVDVEALMERVDIGGIVRRAQIDALVSATAGGLGNRVLDLIRRQLVGLDIIVTRLVDRLLRRRVEEPVSEDGSFTGQIAGGATRLAAFLVDVAIEGVAFALAVAVTYFLASLFVGHDVNPASGNGLWRILALLGLAGLYQWTSLVVAGRTFGRAMAGLRVTAPDGAPLGPAAATRRVLVYPFSFVLGLGLVGVVLSRRHRALHDIAAPSVVRYDWGDRPAEMPAPITQFLRRQGVEVRGEATADLPRPEAGSRVAAGSDPRPRIRGRASVARTLPDATTSHPDGNRRAARSREGSGRSGRGDGAAVGQDHPLTSRHQAEPQGQGGQRRQEGDGGRPRTG